MHISDVRNFNRCPKLYRLSIQDKNYHSFPYFNISINTTESVCHKLGIIEHFEGKPNDNNEDTFKGLEEYQWLTNVRFVYRGLRVKIPFVYHEGNNLQIYFSSLTLFPNDSDMTNICWSVQVLEKLGFKVTDIYLVHLNAEYIREDELDDQQLWVVSDSFYTGKGNPNRKVIESVRKYNLNIDEYLDYLLHFEGEDVSEERSNRCTGKNKCRYYDVCFPQEKELPDNSILTLTSSQNKYSMYHDGLEYLKDADWERLEGTHAQYAQIMADKNGGLYFEQATLNSWLNKVESPKMSFVDFEWDLFPIPPYHDMAPMQVLPFQYSLDVMEDGNITHYEYIGEGDCRKEFVENLLRDLPEEGTIFAYNARGAEIVRLREFQKVFPEYEEELENVINRVVDLALPFINGLVYDVRMRGLYSLKIIHDMIDKKNSYHDLEIENGLEAVEIYRRLDSATPEEKEEYYRELYKYCGLDSYAMVEVYQWLENLTEGNNPQNAEWR